MGLDFSDDGKCLENENYRNLSRWLGLCLAPALSERGLLSLEKGTSGMARTFHRSEEEEDKVDVSTDDNEVES